METDLTPIDNALALQDPNAQPADAMLAQEQAQLAAAQQQLAFDYWAAKTADQVIAELDKKERQHGSVIKSKGFSTMWRVQRAQYYGLDPNDLNSWSTQNVMLEGDQNEMVRFRVNESRSFISQTITMAIGTRPSFQCMATNTDYDSLGQVETSDALIEYVYGDVYGERKERKTVEKSALFGLSWTWLRWDPNGGTPITEKRPVMRALAGGVQQPALDPKTGKPKMQDVATGQRTGEIVMKSLGPWDVFHEQGVDDPEDHIWLCAREKRSKWEIAGLYPEKKDAILAAASNRDRYDISEMFGSMIGALGSHETDEITVKHFYHRGSPALAGGEFSRGRHIMYVGSTMLLDEPLKYERIPLIDLCPNDYIGTSFGYANAWDMCSVNQMLDQIVSDVASNLATFGRQSVWMEEGTTLSPLDIANGMNFLTGPPNSKPPQAVQLAAIPAASQWFLEYLQKRFNSLSGQNSVTRGEPDANITSGQMAALFHSIAIEFNSAFQGAVDNHRERVANMILDILKRFATHPMVAKVAGIDERPYQDSFTRDDFDGVSGVKIKTANPMMRTQAGRSQMAEWLLKIPNALTEPDQLAEVIVSGQLKPAYDAPRKRRMRIKLENEMLLDLAQAPQLPGQPPPVQQKQDPGMPVVVNGQSVPGAPGPAYRCVPSVPVIYLDNHVDHIHEHYALLTSREALLNPTYLDVVTAHIEHHKKIWRECDPLELQALGLPVFPQPVMQPMPANDNAGADAGAPNKSMNPPAAAHQGQQTESAGVKLPQPSKSPVPNNSGAAA